jgi:hypothetical protein
MLRCPGNEEILADALGAVRWDVQVGLDGI